MQLARTKRFKFAGLAIFVALVASALASSQLVQVPKWLTDDTAAIAQALLPDGRVFEVGQSHGVLSAGVVNPKGGNFAVALHIPRQAATATVLPNGKVLIWGGLDANRQVVAGGEWFDPATNEVSDTASVPLLPRAGHTATVLTDGRLLVTGGWNPSLGFLTEAELWDYRTNASEVLATDLTPPRAGHSATLLTDGRVLVLGGYDSAGHRYTDATVFDPSKVAFLDVEAATARELTSSSGAAAIAESIPVDQAVNFPYDGLIALRFSTLMDVTSLQTNSVTLLGPIGATTIQAIPAESGRLLFVHPTSDLLPNSRYTLFINGARTANGTAFPFTGISFTTAGSSQVSTSSGLSSASGGSTSSNNPPSLPGSDISVNGMPATQMALPASTAGVHRIATGSRQSMVDFLATCSNNHTIHGYRFCRETGSIQDGAFIPGHSNTQARWRLNIAQPELLTQRDLPDGALAVGTTAVFGTVLRIDDAPLAHVTVSIGHIAVQTDAQGRFVLNGVPSGHQILLVDGSSANVADAEYGQFYAAVALEENKVNAMPFNLYVPRITARDKVSIPASTTQETVITHPVIPGLEIHIPAGTVFRDRQGHVLTEIAVVPVPADRSPVPLPGNFPVYFSVQPGTATIQGTTAEASKGVRVVYPNYLDSTAGRRHAFWLYDATRQGWMVYTSGHVSQDETQAMPDGQVGVNVPMPAGYTVGGPPPPSTAPPPGSCGSGQCCSGAGNGPGPGLGQGDPGGGPETQGDPVDCYTGLFLHVRTDMSIRDILPISATRTYRPNETTDFAFGRGTNQNYGTYLYTSSTSTAPPEIDLVLPNGSKIPFMLVSGNLDAGGPGLWVSKAFPSQFYGARLTNDETKSPCGVCVILHDGTTLVFPVTGSASAPSYIQKIIDRFGNTVSFQYSAELLTRVTSPSGRTLTYSYNTSNYISQIADQTGRAVTYTYSGDLLTKASYPDGTSEQYGYDANGRMQTVIDRRGNTMVTNVYDSNGRVQQQTLADSTIYRWAYTLSGSTVIATDVTDPRGYVRHTTYDSAGYPLSVTRAYGTTLAQTTAFVRGPDELITSRTDALGRQTRYAYDTYGNSLNVTYLAGTASAVSYSYTYSLDGYNQLLTATDPLGHQTTYSYSNTCLTGVTDPLGHTSTIACNAAGQPLAMTDANGNSEIFTYSGFDLHTQTNALGNTTIFTTDSLGRVTAVQDPLNRLSSVVYDVDDRVSKSVDPLNQPTNYTYDGNSNLLSVTDPNIGKTQFGYDARNRKTSRTDALNQSESWTYDGMGNALTYIDRKQQHTTYNYDALNRMSLTTYADGSTVTPTFDAGNRLTKAVDSASGTIMRIYDGLDRLTQEQTPQGVVNYTYDAANRRATMTPASQAQVAYTYDNADRLTQLKQGTETVGFAYDAGNRRAALTLPNGIVTAYTYDNLNELTGIGYTTGGGTTLATVNYIYDAAGQRVSQTGGFIANPLPTLTTGSNAFDLNNRQTQTNSQTIGYDANGDPTTNNANAQTYTFDVRHRLAQITQGDSTVANFSYDTFGRRTSKTIGGVATAFLYDGQNAVQEAQGGAIYSILTGMGIDERFARSEALGRYYFLTDALGSTLALTDTSTTVQQTYAYEPYGEIGATGSSNNPYQYTGRENDGTGLYYYRARYYSPSLKRFISEDPAGLRAGLNFYAYARNNPLQNVDPRGLAGAPPGARSPFPRYTPPNYLRPPPRPSQPVPDPTGSWPAPVPGSDVPDPDAEDPYPPEYTMYCTIVMCYPSMCTVGAPDTPRQMFFTGDPPYPRRSTVDKMKGCSCEKTRPGDLLGW